jgi:hypothetical protein
MSMAVALVNLVTSGVIESYSNIAAFERAIAGMVPGFTHLPRVPATPAADTASRD